MSENPLAKLAALPDVNPFVVSHTPASPNSYCALSAEFFKTLCQDLCKVLDSLIEEAKQKNNEGTLTPDEFTEFEHLYERLKNRLGINEHHMHIAEDFEAITETDPNDRIN